MNRNRIQSRLFNKVFRHRPNRRLQYLRTCKNTRAKRIRRALRREDLRSSKVLVEVYLPILIAETEAQDHVPPIDLSQDISFT